jgi:GT2 family glycosyltransferase
MQVEILDKYPSVGLTFGNLECVDKKENSLGFITCKPEDYHSPSWEELLIHSIVYSSTVLVRKNLLDKVGRFDTSFEFGYEDADLYLRLRELTSFHFIFGG